MNDFTKEELGIIACNLCVNPKTKNILRKLVSLIDNYCENKKDVWPLYTLSGDLPCAGFCYECGDVVAKELIDE